jgi:hypothetical protein
MGGGEGGLWDSGTPVLSTTTTPPSRIDVGDGPLPDGRGSDWAALPYFFSPSISAITGSTASAQIVYPLPLRCR